MEVKIKKISDEKIKEKDIKSWPIWECSPSEFDWYYDEEEHCYILEGKVIVKTDNGEYEIKSGDYVIFPKGLKCRWIVKEKIRKHYNFF